MVIEQGSAVEAALWSALEALEERAEFLRRVAERHGAGRPRLRDRFHSASSPNVIMLRRTRSTAQT